MTLFGEYEIEGVKKQPTLQQMCKNKFPNDSTLIEALLKYLTSRKQLRNLPSKIAWEEQLKLLGEMGEKDRLISVEKATINGWRSVAFKDYNKKYTPPNEKIIKKDIKESF